MLIRDAHEGHSLGMPIKDADLLLGAFRRIETARHPFHLYVVIGFIFNRYLHTNSMLLPSMSMCTSAYVKHTFNDFEKGQK